MKESNSVFYSTPEVQNYRSTLINADGTECEREAWGSRSVSPGVVLSRGASVPRTEVPFRINGKYSLALYSKIFVFVWFALLLVWVAFGVSVLVSNMYHTTNSSFFCAESKDRSLVNRPDDGQCYYRYSFRPHDAYYIVKYALNPTSTEIDSVETYSSLQWTSLAVISLSLMIGIPAIFRRISITAWNVLLGNEEFVRTRRLYKLIYLYGFSFSVVKFTVFDAKGIHIRLLISDFVTVVVQSLNLVKMLEFPAVKPRCYFFTAVLCSFSALHSLFHLRSWYKKLRTDKFYFALYWSGCFFDVCFLFGNLLTDNHEDNMFAQFVAKFHIYNLFQLFSVLQPLMRLGKALYDTEGWFVLVEEEIAVVQWDPAGEEKNPSMRRKQTWSRPPISPEPGGSGISEWAPPPAGSKQKYTKFVMKQMWLASPQRWRAIFRDEVSKGIRCAIFGVCLALFAWSILVAAYVGLFYSNEQQIFHEDCPFCSLEWQKVKLVSFPQQKRCFCESMDTSFGEMSNHSLHYLFKNLDKHDELKTLRIEVIMYSKDVSLDAVGLVYAELLVEVPSFQVTVHKRLTFLKAHNMGRFKVNVQDATSLARIEIMYVEIISWSSKDWSKLCSTSKQLRLVVFHVIGTISHFDPCVLRMRSLNVFSWENVQRVGNQSYPVLQTDENLLSLELAYISNIDIANNITIRNTTFYNFQGTKWCFRKSGKECNNECAIVSSGLYTVGDYLCDRPENYFSVCDWDGGDCGPPVNPPDCHCPPYKVAQDTMLCDWNCNTPECHYDNGYCVPRARGGYDQWLCEGCIPVIQMVDTNKNGLLDWDEAVAKGYLSFPFTCVPKKKLKCLFETIDNMTWGNRSIPFASTLPYYKDSIVANPDGKRFQNVSVCLPENAGNPEDLILYPTCFSVINQTRLPGFCDNVTDPCQNVSDWSPPF